MMMMMMIMIRNYEFSEYPCSKSQTSFKGVNKFPPFIKTFFNLEVELLYLKFVSDAVGRDSSVGIATGYGLDDPGIESRWGARFSAPVQTGPGAHAASCTMGTGSFPGGKERPGRDADPSSPSSAVVMKG